jgi:Zn-dependent protease
MYEDLAVFAPPAPPRRERWWLHGLLFALTCVSSTIAGVYYAVNFDPSLLPLDGAFTPAMRLELFGAALFFSVPLMLILFSHEMGHYLMCRKYGIDASPPYFIPFLSFAGTLGAFIRIREPFRNKRHLFDVGVAGPLAGFAVAIPVMIFGILRTRPNISSAVGEGVNVFQYPIFVTLFQKLLLHRTFTSMDVVEHPAFMAGWWGFFVTAFNLIPLGQLDGGHAIYAVTGRFQRIIAIPIFAVLFLLGFKFPGWWVLGVMVLLMGLRHPRVPDEDEPLDMRRMVVAGLCTILLVGCFIPVPVSEIDFAPSAPSRAPRGRRGVVVERTVPWNPVVPAGYTRGLERQMKVAGPSLTSSTSIGARNLPVETGTPYARSVATY